MPRAAVLVTGDEILRGRIRERNAGILARSLEEHGVAVDRIEMVGDGLAAIGGALERLLGEGHDLICTSGGLGPTHDDLTMEAVGRATGRPLELDPRALELVRAHSRGATGDPAVIEALHRKQASLPRGALMLPPPGTAPGCVVRHGDSVVVVLPGPPWELEAMWASALLEAPVAEVVARAPARAERVLRVQAVPESALVSALEGFDPAAWERLTVGICARDGELEVTVRAAPRHAGAVEALEARVRDAFGDALYSRDGRTVDDVVAEALVAAGQTVAVAESCTGGLLGGRLTARPGSSAYVRGGIVAYDNAAKHALLDVPEWILAEHGAVSAECAQAMARGARRALGADWALSTTGVAGPGGGTPDKPVGLVYIGVAGPDDSLGHLRQQRGGDRSAIRERAVTGALHLLRRSLAAGTAVHGPR